MLHYTIVHTQALALIGIQVYTRSEGDNEEKVDRKKDDEEEAQSNTRAPLDIDHVKSQRRNKNAKDCAEVSLKHIHGFRAKASR